MHPTFPPLRIAAMLATVALFAQTARAEALRFCIDQASPSAAIDAGLAQAIAARQGAKAELFRYRGEPKGDDADFDLRAYKTLLAERCDLVLGFPFDASTGTLPKFLKATSPYATTGFVLVTRTGDARSTLAAFGDGTRIGVPYNTMPNFYFGRHPRLVREILADDADVVDALEHGRVDAAMLWRPGAVKALAQARASSKYEFHALDEAGASWPLVALHGDAGAGFARRFEVAIAAMRDDGTLAKVLRGYADANPSRLRSTAAQPGASIPGSQRHARPARRCAGAKPGKSKAAHYTVEQAEAGKQLFADKCALCHGKEMEGRNGPMLKGKMFLSRDAKHTLGEIFTIVAQNMPATAPASLPQDEYEKLMAYILQVNGFPATGTALSFEEARQSKALLVYKEPK
ncbi:c-type cytochrome [Dokdonella sp.]|uniref:c-type cytochrome n=1 Tax=Dokdonella sp. TaxID=2291710 RepID=UPI002617D942|nr:c-type cytochrome [Dokdonella sp.]